MANVKQLLKKSILAFFVIAEDAIDNWSDQDGDRIMREALTRARDRASYLALENARLQDEVDFLKSEKPILYKDESAVLGFVISECDLENRDYRILLNLIDRHRTLDYSLSDFETFGNDDEN